MRLSLAVDACEFASVGGGVCFGGTAAFLFDRRFRIRRIAATDAMRATPTETPTATPIVPGPDADHSDDPGTYDVEMVTDGVMLNVGVSDRVAAVLGLAENVADSVIVCVAEVDDPLVAVTEIVDVFVAEAALEEEGDKLRVRDKEGEAERVFVLEAVAASPKEDKRASRQSKSITFPMVEWGGRGQRQNSGDGMAQNGM